MTTNSEPSEVTLRYTSASAEFPAPETSAIELIVDGDVVEMFSVYPSLSELRDALHEHAPRLDLYDAGLQCPECQRVITEETRFAAVNHGVYCKECVENEEPQSPAGSDLTITNDPTKTVLGKSELHHKRLIDYNVNIATGCAHGCAFCYTPGTPQIRTQKARLKESADVDDTASEWGDYVLYRDDAPERLRREIQPAADRGFDNWIRTPEGLGIVGLSFHTDCYQSSRGADITRACVDELLHHDRYIRILTRSPNVVRDKELFANASDQITVGMSIPSLDDAALRAIETTAPPPTARYRAMQELADAGVRTYVSMGPTLPTQDKSDLRALLRQLSDLDPDVIFHEPLNPRGPNFDRTVKAARENGEDELADAINRLADDREWREYAFEQIRWVHELGRELSLPVYCWPTGELTSGAHSEYAEWWRSQESPEPFAGRDPEWEVPPEVPAVAPNQRTALSDFVK